MRRGPHIVTESTSQDGFTLVEVLVAAFLVLVGLMAILAALDVSARTALSAQRHEQGISYAQRELEKLKTYPYAQLALSSAPAHQADGNPANDPTPNAPRNPNFYVVDPGTFQIKADYQNRNSAQVTAVPEPLVTGGTVDPGPTAFADGATTGTVYRFITYRKENCGAITVAGVTVLNPCPGLDNSKRITVAVVLNRVGNDAGPAKPVWVSSVVTDPNATPVGVDAPPTANPGSGPPVTAQPFFLYDTPCHFGARQVISGAHTSHNTAQSPSSTACVAPNEPDLMGPDAPPNGTGTNVYDYSSEVARPNPVGLALQRYDSGCPTTYSALNATTLKSSVHTWATRPFGAPFTTAASNSRAALSVWTRTRDGQPGSAVLCATLRDAVTGLVVGSGTYTQPEWPTTFTQVSFAFDTLPAYTFVTGTRLLLTVSLRSTSSNDVVLLYDHPDYQTFLSVATTTPL